MSPVQRQNCKVHNSYITELSRTGEWTWLINSPRAKGHSPRVTGECNSRALTPPPSLIVGVNLTWAVFNAAPYPVEIHVPHPNKHTLSSSAAGSTYDSNTTPPSLIVWVHLTWAVFNAAPYPVEIPHPNRHTLSRGAAGLTYYINYTPLPHCMGPSYLGCVQCCPIPSGYTASQQTHLV